MKKNRYPLPERTVLYSNKKYIQPVPEVGKKYHCFDDGKVTFSRHFIIQVDEVLGHQQFKKKYPTYFKVYRAVVKNCYWLYSTHSDKFVITYKGENDEFGVYVRTKQGGWFGIGGYWNSARLDSSGIIWDTLVSEARKESGIDKKELERIIKENTL